MKQEVGDTEPYIYVGLRANDESLSDCFAKEENLDMIVVTFKKEKKGSYGIGEIVNIKRNSENNYNLKKTGTYISGQDEKLRQLGKDSWAEELDADREKIRIKQRKDSAKIDDMTIKEVLDTSDWRQKRAIVTYLISKIT